MRNLFLRLFVWPMAIYGVLFSTALAGPKSLDPRNLNELRVGQTQSQVQERLGEPTTKSVVEGVNRWEYAWTDTRHLTIDWSGDGKLQSARASMVPAFEAADWIPEGMTLVDLPAPDLGEGDSMPTTRRMSDPETGRVWTILMLNGRVRDFQLYAPWNSPEKGRTIKTFMNDLKVGKEI